MSVAPGPIDALGLVGVTIDQVRFDACVDAGGFGLIYRGYHEGLGETVAIKCLRIASIQRTNEEIRIALAGRFRDETKLLYRLSQGNLDIVRCISSGTLVAPKTKEYTPYMVLEWLEGCTLSAELRQRRDRHLGVRTLEEAVKLLDSAVGGIAYAHAHDVVHRDVKPGNLFALASSEAVIVSVLARSSGAAVADGRRPRLTGRRQAAARPGAQPTSASSGARSRLYASAAQRSTLVTFAVPRTGRRSRPRRHRRSALVNSAVAARSL